MKNTFGESVAVTLFGESHGAVMGAVLDGLAPGIPVEEAQIADALSRRRPQPGIGTARIEADEFTVVSGVYEGRTTGAPLTVLVYNKKQDPTAYESLRDTPRPGHADFAARLKYHGFEDTRGGGHFSGRLTAPLVAVGAVARRALHDKGVTLGAHVLSVASAADRRFSEDPAELEKELAALAARRAPVLDAAVWEAMRDLIDRAAKDGDSVGGVLECAATGLPGGVGEPFFDSLESKIAHAMFSIPAVKGIEFGAGFGFADLSGSHANDAYGVKNGIITQLTNRCGGVIGGVSTGAPLRFALAVKPTPSIKKEQKTVDLKTNTETKIALCGRHDPCILPRLFAVAEAMLALTLCDALALRFGTDYLGSANL